MAPGAKFAPCTNAGYEWKTVTLLCLGFGLVGNRALAQRLC